MELNERIVSVRIRAGFTTTEMAKRLGWGISRLKNYETGYRTPKNSDLRHISDDLKDIIGDQFYFLVTGDTIEDYIRENTERFNSSLTIAEISEVLDQTLETMSEIGSLQFRDDQAISDTIKLTIRRCENKLKTRQ